jgi:hypothetical protein
MPAPRMRQTAELEPRSHPPLRSRSHPLRRPRQNRCPRSVVDTEVRGDRGGRRVIVRAVKTANAAFNTRPATDRPRSGNREASTATHKPADHSPDFNRHRCGRRSRTSASNLARATRTSPTTSPAPATPARTAPINSPRQPDVTHALSTPAAPARTSPTKAPRQRGPHSPLQRGPHSPLQRGPL